MLEAPTCRNQLLCFYVVQWLSCVWLFVTPCQTSLSFTMSQSLLKLMPIESVMPANHLILCLPLLLLPSIFPSIRALAKILIWLILHFLQTLMISHCLRHEVWKSLAWNTRVFTNWPCQISPAPIHFLLPFYSWLLPTSYTLVVQNLEIYLKIPDCLKSLKFSICFFCLKWLFISSLLKPIYIFLAFPPQAHSKNKFYKRIVMQKTNLWLPGGKWGKR